jgi:hypothetical protein
MEDFFSYIAWGLMALFLIWISANANKQNITQAEEMERREEEAKQKKDKEEK